MITHSFSILLGTTAGYFVCMHPGCKQIFERRHMTAPGVLLVIAGYALPYFMAKSIL